MPRRAAVAVLIFLTVAAAPARARTPAELAHDYQAAAEGNKPLQALEALQAATNELWKTMPLTLRFSTLTEGPASGYGVYTPRRNNRYRAGEQIYLYTEPVGYGVVRKDDLFSFGLAVDFNLLDASGKVLGGQRDFGKWETQSRRFNTEFEMHFNFDFSGLVPGSYTLELTVRDKNGKGSAILRQPLVVE